MDEVFNATNISSSIHNIGELPLCQAHLTAELADLYHHRPAFPANVPACCIFVKAFLKTGTVVIKHHIYLQWKIV
jgi:hypothetical protein